MKVFAVDTNTDLLRFINKRSKKQEMQNVVTIVADASGFGLSGENCNLIFFRNVFHHIDNAEVYFRNIQQHLKPNGRIAIIEWLNQNGANGRHSTSELKICKVMETAGYKRINAFDFLHNQSFNIFVLNSALAKSS
jgi:ubiquinone/menaquinone biosynthesis C-methylase UbiE